MMRKMSNARHAMQTRTNLTMEKKPCYMTTDTIASNVLQANSRMQVIKVVQNGRELAIVMKTINTSTILLLNE
jgi:hypothetical protein